MAGVRFTDLQSRPMAFRDFTSLTLNEFQQLVPPFGSCTRWLRIITSSPKRGKMPSYHAL